MTHSKMYHPAEQVEEIVRFIKNYGEDPYRVLVRQVTPMIEMMTTKYFLRGYSQEDFNQEAFALLVQCVKDFNAEYGMPFMQYFNLRLTNRLRGLLRYEKALKRRACREAYSLDKVAEEYGESAYPYADIRSDPLEMTVVLEYYDHYIEDLSNFELSVFLMYQNGHPVEDIATILHCSSSKAQNAIYRCRKKMKDLLKSRQEAEK